jgi:hypothetical protein
MSSTAANTTALACTLSNAEYKRRRAQIRKRLVPRITHLKFSDLTLLLEFDPRDNARDEAEIFIDLERRCCGFLEFALSPPEAKLNLVITGPEGSQLTLKIFANAVSGRT